MNSLQVSYLKGYSLSTLIILSTEIKELRTQYIVTKDSLVIKSKQTEVARALMNTGIKESIVPPQKILVTTTDNLKNDIGN